MTAPIVISEGATNITTKKATLVGTVRAMGGLPTTAWFHYAPGPLFLNSSTPSVTITQAWQSYSLEVDVSVTTFINRFRAVAGNTDGVSFGDYIKYWVPQPGKDQEGSPFYIRQREVEWADRDLTLYLWSDVPTTLRLRVSKRPPWKKRGFHFKRGRVFHHSPIVHWAWSWEIPQQEVGDVELHTFTIPYPDQYNTLWMQATGWVDGKISPSRSPFFRYSYTPAVLDLGIYGQPDALDDHVFLEEGTDIVLTYVTETNTIKISRA